MEHTARDAAEFTSLGWEIIADLAIVNLPVFGCEIAITASADCEIQYTDTFPLAASGAAGWKVVRLGNFETPMLAACAACDWFYSHTGLELLNQGVA